MTTTNIIKIAAIAAVPLLLASRYAQAAETTVITLSCDGTYVAGDAKPEPINKMGVIVDLAQNTVTFGGFAAKIKNIDAAVISFAGEKQSELAGVSVDVEGNIDRVTGRLWVTTLLAKAALTYDLLCKPTSRLSPDQGRGAADGGELR